MARKMMRLRDIPRRYPGEQLKLLKPVRPCKVDLLMRLGISVDRDEGLISIHSCQTDTRLELPICDREILIDYLVNHFQ